MADGFITAAASAVANWFSGAVYSGLTQVGVSAATASTVSMYAASISGALTVGGIYAGLTLAAVPSIPKPEAGRRPIRQARPSRIYGVGGYCRVSGAYMHRETANNKLGVVLALMEGPAEFSGQYYLNDDAVTLTGGFVDEGDDGRYRGDLVQIQTRTGLATETAYAPMITAFPDTWTSAHRGDGISSLMMLATHTKREKFNIEYPNGEPIPSAVQRARCYDWRDPAQDREDPTTWEASTNPIVWLVHCEWARFGRSWSRCIEPVLDALTVEADYCDDVVAKVGGTEPRYQCAGWYPADIEPDAVRQALLASCDGWMTADGRGRLVIKSGRYEAPTFTITGEHIEGYLWRAGREAEEDVNELVVSFTSAAHDYSEIHCDPWRDEDAITAAGKVYSQNLELTWVPSFSQARRLAKRKMSRLQALRSGQVRTGIYGLNGLGQRYIRIQNPDLSSMSDVVCEVTNVEIDFPSGQVIFDIIQADPNIDAWNPATEEGAEPVVGERPAPEALSAPTIEGVTPFFEAGQTRLEIETTGPNRTDLDWFWRWRVTGTTTWAEGAATDVTGTGEVTFATGFVAAEASIDVQVAYITGGGSQSPWSDTTVTDGQPVEDPAQEALDAYLDAMTVQPSPTRAGRYYDLIKALMDAGVWAKERWIQIAAAHDAQAGLINLKDPTELATAVASPTFTASGGYQGNGSTSYLETGFDPSDGDSLFTLNDAHMGVWCLTEGQEAAPICGNTQSRIVPRNTSDAIVTRANTSESDAVATASALGHTAWVRTDSGNTRTFRNGVMVEAETSTSVAFIANETFRIGGSDNTGTDSFSNKQVAVFHFGAALTDGEMAALHAALNDYLTAVGAV
ncbi:hypothetical protein [Phenylobacterium sp.]|uniref:hypothetical protein n=1 Tax=Phenylobacterium sp. TaxID=1871053 RepID=UPI003003098D